MAFLREHYIRVVDFPPYLLDLNPIKHMWWMLKRVLHRLYPELDTIGRSAEDWERFCSGLKEAWRKIPNAYIKKLILSMP
jgi:hypothetical protein